MKCEISKHGSVTLSKTRTSCGDSLKESLARLEESLFEAKQALEREERKDRRKDFARRIKALECSIKAIKRLM